MSAITKGEVLKSKGQEQYLMEESRSRSSVRIFSDPGQQDQKMGLTTAASDPIVLKTK